MRVVSIFLSNSQLENKNVLYFSQNVKHKAYIIGSITYFVLSVKFVIQFQANSSEHSQYTDGYIHLKVKIQNNDYMSLQSVSTKLVLKLFNLFAGSLWV